MPATKEALIAAVTLYMVIKGELKDGFQAQDIVDLFKKFADDANFHQVIMNAYQDAAKIPDEVKNFNAAEAFDLATVIPQLIEILKAA